MPELVEDWLTGWANADTEGLALTAAAGSWTVRALEQDVAGLASWLRARVDGREDGRVAPSHPVDDRAGVVPAAAVVAALLEDDAPAVIVSHAVRRLAQPLLLLDRRAAPGELADQLRLATPSILLSDAPNQARARELGDALGIPSARIDARFDRAGERERGPAPDVDLDAPATIVFTSGTSGRARAALLTHRNHIASADAWADVLAPRPTDRWLACLPLYHIAGQAILMRAGRWRVPLEVVPRFDAQDVVERIRGGTSHLSLVPTQLDRLLETWGARPVPASLRAILLGGAPITGGTLAAARALGLPVLTTYGMTETASGIAVGGTEPATLGDPSALRPLPGVGVRVGAADEQGIGAIDVRGPMVFAGYVGDRAATDECLSGGWLRTGDLGSLDDDGLLRIADRRLDLIVSGGENVYPAEVEAILREHADVIDAAVVGVADTTWGSVPVAAVVLAPGSTTDADLARHCRQRLAGFKVPVAFHRLEELPRNEAGKVLRRELRDRLAGTRP